MDAVVLLQIIFHLHYWSIEEAKLRFWPGDLWSIHCKFGAKMTIDLVGNDPPFLKVLTQTYTTDGQIQSR